MLLTLMHKLLRVLMMLSTLMHRLLQETELQESVAASYTSTPNPARCPPGRRGREGARQGETEPLVVHAMLLSTCARSSEIKARLCAPQPQRRATCIALGSCKQVAAIKLLKHYAAVHAAHDGDIQSQPQK